MNKQNLVDTVLLVEPPQSWWPQGPVGYLNDPASTYESEHGGVPNSPLVWHEFHGLRATLVAHEITHVVMRFPQRLLSTATWKGAYDAVFPRDGAVVAPSGTAFLPASFAETQREIEVPHLTDVLELLGLERIHEKPRGFFEGGEVATGYLPNSERFLFTGNGRNDAEGNEFLRSTFGVRGRNHATITMVEDVFHKDTALTTMTEAGPRGRELRGAIIAEKLVVNGLNHFQNLVMDAGAAYIPTHVKDSGIRPGGSLALNGITPGGPGERNLISGAYFHQNAVADKVEALGYRRAVAPLTQYRQYSTGGAHCATQLIRVSEKKLTALKADMPYEIVDIWRPASHHKALASAARAG